MGNKLKYFSILFFLLSFLVTELVAQSQRASIVDTTEAHEVFERARDLVKAKRMRAAIPLIDSAISKYKLALGETHPSLIKCYDAKMTAHIAMRQYPQTQETAQDGLKLLRRLNMAPTEMEAKMHLNLALAYTELKEYKLSEANLVKASIITSELGGVRPKMRSLISFEFGVVKKKQRKFDEALNFYLTALESFQELNDSTGVGNALYNLGNIEYEKRRHALARYYYKESLRYYSLTSHRQLTLAHYAIALTYNRERAYELALDYLSLASRNAYIAFGQNHPFSKKILVKIGQTYNVLGDYGNGVRFIESQPSLKFHAPALLELAKGHFELAHLDRAESYLIESLNPTIASKYDSISSNYFYSKLLRAKGEFDKAEHVALNNWEARKKNYGPKSTQPLYGAFSIAKVFAGKRRFREALYILDTLLENKLHMNVVLENSDTIKTQAWDDIFQYKIEVLYTQQKESPSEENYMAASDAMLVYLQSIEVVRKNTGVPGSHLGLNVDRSDVVGRMLDLLYDKYQSKPSEEIVGDALLYTDYVRDLLWVDIVKYRQATDLSEHQLKLLKKENKLRKQIASLELNKEFASDSVTSTDELAQLKSALGGLNNQRTVFHEKEFNNGHQIIESIRTDMDGDVVSFFFYKNSLYRIFVNTTEAQMKCIAWEKNESSILENLVLQMSSQQLLPESELAQLSTKLLSDLPLKIGRPIKFYLDGELHALPFEILVDPASGAPIIENHPISYNSSLKRANFSFNDIPYDTDLIAFAPNYEKWSVGVLDTSNSPALSSLVRFGMTDLPAAKEEVKAIGSIVSGKSFLEDQATVSNFLKECGDSRILHLSMHAMSESEQPNLSRLIFSAENKKNQLSRYCFAGEIATQEIPAEMVVLSACNTGLGELVKGEGVLSLARAFEYAGARSTVFSLWRIPDIATKEIMKEFYQQLVDKKSKSEALRNAKLVYRDRHENTSLAHPFYWAGFVLNGETEAISFSKVWWQTPWIWIGLTLCLLLFIISIRRNTK